MRKQYKIADLTLSIENFNFSNRDWEKFKTDRKSNIQIILKNEERGQYKNIEKYTELQTGDTLIRCEEDIIVVSSSWEYNRILNLRHQENGEMFFMQIFYTHAVQRHMLQLHSSLISHQNQGIMFLGPSGIGKTTQAELWQKYRSSLIINGDIVFVQETDSGFLGWGTPWHGSSPYCENTSVPLKAMVVLKQSDQNSIRELTGFEKVTEVSNSVFYPQWLENGMELCLETLDHLLTSIPVYELRCRPDEDAVRLTEQTIFS